MFLKKIEEAYGKVNWCFFQQVLHMKGFLPKWCQWIQYFISKVNVGIKVYDDVGHYFQTHN
jgi:hypothetical protein